VRLALTVNGSPVELEARPDETLLTILRRDLGLLSVRETCGIGVCGACTVLVNGRALSACLLLAPLAESAEVTTAEGLPPEHAVVRAFAQAHAFQCGFCTPGMVLSVTALLRENDNPSDEEISLALAGNLCRCGCYVEIAKAVRLAAAESR
jgi:aerobic-type carbon monoxide dehydrogenase small subunit (CoxS/CutS family)